MLRLIAALLIVSGFGIMIFPESWNIRLHHKLGIKWSCCYPTEAILLNEEVEQSKIMDLSLRISLPVRDFNIRLLYETN